MTSASLGHPMAGSELEGLDAADPHMFDGAIWVLTPDLEADDENFSVVASLVREVGSEVVALSPTEHDRLVAVVSHLPHLTAASLMSLAQDRSEEHASLLRLAAGGFRDMTRIASGSPRIWIDICQENRVAILEAIDDLNAALNSVRSFIEAEEKPPREHAPEGSRIKSKPARSCDRPVGSLGGPHSHPRPCGCRSRGVHPCR